MVPILVFAAVSLVTLGAAIAVVTNKNVLHSAYFLVLSFVGVASVYVLLEAPFIAVIQVLIYIG
ncbi:MAG: NADH-quinone oxidoreductase subunit J, partial [Chloroflexota bacterium]